MINSLLWYTNSLTSSTSAVGPPFRMEICMACVALFMDIITSASLVPMLPLIVLSSTSTVSKSAELNASITNSSLPWRSNHSVFPMIGVILGIKPGVELVLNAVLTWIDSRCQSPTSPGRVLWNMLIATLCRTLAMLLFALLDSNWLLLGRCFQAVASSLTVHSAVQLLTSTFPGVGMAELRKSKLIAGGLVLIGAAVAYPLCTWAHQIFGLMSWPRGVFLVLTLLCGLCGILIYQYSRSRKWTQDSNFQLANCHDRSVSCCHVGAVVGVLACNFMAHHSLASICTLVPNLVLESFGAHHLVELSGIFMLGTCLHFATLLLVTATGCWSLQRSWWTLLGGQVILVGGLLTYSRLTMAAIPGDTSSVWFLALPQSTSWLASALLSLSVHRIVHVILSECYEDDAEERNKLVSSLQTTSTNLGLLSGSILCGYLASWWSSLHWILLSAVGGVACSAVLLLPQICRLVTCKNPGATECQEDDSFSIPMVNRLRLYDYVEGIADSTPLLNKKKHQQLPYQNVALTWRAAVTLWKGGFLF